MLAGVAGMIAAPPLNALRTHITKTRISAITDEIGNTQAEAIEFAHKYGMQWVELRNVPETKKEFATLTEPELKRWSAELASNKLRVSFLNTSLLEFTWPGMERDGKPADTKRWERRKEDLSNALLAANILEVDKVRIFAGTRVEKPESVYPLIVRTLEELIPMAEKAKVRLAIENETSQNIGTSAEVKEMLGLISDRTLGYNWDPQNAVGLGERPWPDGYMQLPKDRMLNAQFKAKGLLDDSPEKLDWKSILEAMQKDNYRGEIGLETHIFDGTLIDKANESMKIIMHMVGELS